MKLSGQGLYGGDVIGKGARLFSDYQNLMKIWTHPWVLRLAEIRDENKVSIVVKTNLVIISWKNESDLVDFIRPLDYS